MYDLFSVKPKKNRKIDFQQSRQVIFFLLQSVNPWNTPQILDILLTPTNREEQNMVKLISISFLTTNWSQALRPELFRVIQHVSDIMSNLKPRIQQQATTTMKVLLNSTGNQDLTPFLPTVLEIFNNVNNITEAVEKLAGCVFVQNVELPALAVMIPVILNGLQSNKTETRRKSCVILSNMTKLVEHPKEIVPLISEIEPTLKKCMDEMSDPEAREVVRKNLWSPNPFY